MSEPVVFRPNEFLKLQRLKQKQKALQARLKKPAATPEVAKNAKEVKNLSTKRRNPFARPDENVASKKQRCDVISTDSTEDSLFELLAKSEAKPITAKKPIVPEEDESADSAYSQSMKSFKLQREEEECVEHIPEDVLPFLPMDWTVKSKLRILSTIPIVSSNLKTNQEASGLSCFVRGIDMENTSTSLDSSLGAQIHQGTFYWQHPNLPWMTLYPRNSKDNNKFHLGEPERQALAKCWAESFRSLFQLVRSRQCPYFYVCANSFTALFRAAGIGGREETHAIVTPTTRGFRQALKEEEIEFTMPLKVKPNDTPEKRLSGNGSLGKEPQKQQLQENNKNATNDDSGTMTDLKVEDEENDDDDEDLGEEQWLESLGVEAIQIQEITRLDSRRQNRKDLDSDKNDQSAILIEGVECQAFFNFLFNAKSTTNNVGKLAGVPPTLLAPVAFLGATLNHIQTRTSKVRMDNVDYHSVELRGVILPHILPLFNHLVRGMKHPSFSASMVNHMDTLSLTKVAIKLLDNESNDKEHQSDHVFGQENLSDCGLNNRIVANMCRSGPKAVRVLERMCYNSESGYTF